MTMTRALLVRGTERCAETLGMVAIKQSATQAIGQPQQAAELLALIIKDAQRGLDALGKSAKPEATARPR